VGWVYCIVTIPIGAVLGALLGNFIANRIGRTL
jgi:hypothetical protein